MFQEGKMIYEAMVKRMEDLKNGVGISGKVENLFFCQISTNLGAYQNCTARLFQEVNDKCCQK